MITDAQANAVYFSELLATDPRFGQTWDGLRIILDKHRIKYGLISGTADIWARDYMPIQVNKNKLVQFRYDPSYLSDEPELKTDLKVMHAASGISPEINDLNVDGGNIIRWNDKVIVTRRVFKENPGLSQPEVLHRLETALGVPVLVIPDINTDVTGHADGHVRFIDGQTVLVNDLAEEYIYWREGFLKMIGESGLIYEEMPWFTWEDKENPDSTVGCYVNYLEIGDVILFPVFEVEGNKDMEALNVIRRVFPKKEIEPINVNDVARFGGLLNCISWTVKH